jgi:hypothetical protein
MVVERCFYCDNYLQCVKDPDLDSFNPCSCYSTKVDLTKKSDDEINLRDRAERMTLPEETVLEESEDPIT